MTHFKKKINKILQLGLKGENEEGFIYTSLGDSGTESTPLT